MAFPVAVFHFLALPPCKKSSNYVFKSTAGDMLRSSRPLPPSGRVTRRYITLCRPYRILSASTVL